MKYPLEDLIPNDQVAITISIVDTSKELAWLNTNNKAEAAEDPGQ